MDKNNSLQIIEINSKIKNIDKNLENIDKQINSINSKIELLLKSCTNMDEHINFIDNVYNNIKSPLNYVLNKVNIISILDRQQTQTNFIDYKNNKK